VCFEKFSEMYAVYYVDCCDVVFVLNSEERMSWRNICVAALHLMNRLPVQCSSKQMVQVALLVVLEMVSINIASHPQRPWNIGAAGQLLISIILFQSLCLCISVCAYNLPDPTGTASPIWMKFGTQDHPRLW